MLDRSQHQRVLVVLTMRWLAVIKQNGRFFVFNPHSTRTDGSQDFLDLELAFIFMTESAEEAATFVKQFGCAEDMPFGHVSCHSVAISHF